MRKFAIGSIAAVGIAVAMPAYAGHYKSGIHHRAEARAAYASAPRHRHHYRAGASINVRDPIRKALDEPRMYGRPDRH